MKISKKLVDEIKNLDDVTIDLRVPANSEMKTPAFSVHFFRNIASQKEFYFLLVDIIKDKKQDVFMKTLPSSDHVIQMLRNL